jgi:hypothetical protein
MFLIKIDGHRADWQKGLSVRLNRKNPIFEFDSITGNLVNDFLLPFSPTNDKLFGHFYNPQSQFLDKDYICEKYVDGQLIEHGTIQLKETTQNGYQVIYVQNFGEFFGDYQFVSLNNIDFGTESVRILPKSINHLTDKYCFPQIKNTGFYGANPVAGYNGIVNSLATSPQTPMLFLKFLFEKIAEKCNCTFDGEFFEHEAIQRLILYNTFALDGDSNIRFQNHLPQITIPELLKELRKLFNLGIFINLQNRTITIRFADELLSKDTKLNWTNKVVPSTQRSPLFANRLELDWQLESNDDMMKVVPNDFKKYETSQENIRRGTLFSVKSKFSSLEIDPDTGLSVVVHAGITTTNNQKNNGFSPRLLFWNGIVKNKATATNTYGSYRLAWHGPNNLKSNFWSKYESFRSQTCSRKMMCILNANDLAQIDFHRRKGETLAVHIKGRDYYIDEVATPLPLEGRASEVLFWER